MASRREGEGQHRGRGFFEKGYGWDFAGGLVVKTQHFPSRGVGFISRRGTKPVHPKGNQPFIFIGRTDAEAEAPVFWPPDVQS